MLTACQNRRWIDYGCRPLAEAEQRHGRGAEDATGGAEAVRRGRASPTPTVCAQSHAERPQGQGSPQGWTETPTVTQHTLTTSTGAQERRTLPEVVQGYPGHPHALHSPSGAPQATQGGRSSAVVAQGMTHRQSHAEGTQSRHRPRQEARGTATHPPHQDEPQPHEMSRRRCTAYLYEYE